MLAWESLGVAGGRGVKRCWDGSHYSGSGPRNMLAMDPLYYVVMEVAGGRGSSDVAVGVVGGQYTGVK